MIDRQTLTVCGVDRRLFFLALLLGAATFNLFYSFVAGCLVFVALYAFGFWSIVAWIGTPAWNGLQ